MNPRWIPRLIVITAVLHFGWAFAQPHAWSAIVGDGFFRAVADDSAPDFWAREATIWFMLCGVALLALGTLTGKALRDTGKLPAQTGWYLLVMGIPLSVLYFPVTGSWALVVIGVLALTARAEVAA
ncbi:DUF6463 family protein [Actinosynnema sp. CS-041913]|uniref:DUF6463 family protein n=1 Tax=Actinosynnema sp. CS-041913 TaxID=3239917 RepID=UPI003D923138